MKIAIIGATGFVGSAVLNEALQRGHTVTAIARNNAQRIEIRLRIHWPQKVTKETKGLTFIKLAGIRVPRARGRGRSRCIFLFGIFANQN